MYRKKDKKVSINVFFRYLYYYVSKYFNQKNLTSTLIINKLHYTLSKYKK